MISFTRIASIVLVSILLTLGLSQLLWAEEKQKEVSIDWEGEVRYQGFSVSGDENLRRTHSNDDSGWYLDHLEITRKEKDGFFESLALSAKGWGSQGTVPSQDYRATVKKRGLYQFELRHHRYDDVFALSDFLAGFHGSASQRKRTQSSLKIFPLENVVLGMKYGNHRWEGREGETFHNPWDEFALTNQNSWKSKNYGGSAELNGERMSLVLDHTYQTHDKRENQTPLENALQGFDSSDLTELTQYAGSDQHKGDLHHSKISFQYTGDVNIVAHYRRLHRTLESAGGTHLIETSPAGAERDVNTHYVSDAERSVTGGELMGSWQFPHLPARIRVAVRDFQESIETSSFNHQETMVFEFPVIVEETSTRQIDLQNTGANLALDFGPLGPFSFTLGGDISKRTIERAESTNGFMESDQTNQDGKALEAGMVFKENGWKVSTQHVLRDANSDYTTQSPLEDRLTKASVSYQHTGGWFLESSASHRNQTNTTLEYGVQPIFESTLRTIYFGGGYNSPAFSLHAGLAYLDMETQTLFLETNEGAEDILPVLRMEDFQDGSNHLHASWKPREGMEARLQAHVLNSSLFEAWRIEPHFKARVSKKHNLWLDIGAFRYRYEEKQGSRHYQNDAIMIGLGTASSR